MSRRVVGITCIILALVGLTWLLAGWQAGAKAQSGDAVWYEQVTADDPEMSRLLKEAQQYNQTHPFNPKDGAGDQEYQEQLNKPDGIMASVDYPRLGIRLAVRHGTTEDVLSSGAGHLPGTSLPVGGKGTRTVISGHRGGTTPLFTRLGEAKKGDVFHITAAGQTIAYRVTDIRVLDPTDTAALAPKAGEDLATLLTCTPYGVNTKRLAVTGRRTRMPGWTTRPADRKPVGAVWLLAAAWTVGIATLIPFEGEDHEIQEYPRPHRRGVRRARHARRAVGARLGPEGDRRNHGDETPPLRGGHDPQP